MKDHPSPNSFQAEVAMLGSMILDADMIVDVLAIVPRAEYLHEQAHVTIFRAILDVFDRRNPRHLDLILIQDRLKHAGVYDAIGGDAKLLEVVHSVPSAANAVYYAGIVAEKYRLRQLIDRMSTILHDATHAGATGDDSKELIDRAESAIFEITNDVQNNEPEDLSVILNRIMARVEANDGHGSVGQPTGFRDLDGLMGGLQPGELIIVAARVSVGKTSLGLCLAEQMALGARRVPVGVFSLEMSKDAIGERMLATRAGVSSFHLRSGFLGGDQLRDVIQAQGELSAGSMVIDDTPSISVMTLRAKARRMVRKRGVKALVVDYAQLMTAPDSSRESRQVEVSAVSRGLKGLARELNIPIVCMAQLNRDCEKREGFRPRLSDLRESGSLESDADVCILIHREEYYHINDPEWIKVNHDKAGLAELIVAKNRNGKTGVVKLHWGADTTRFSDWNEG